MKAKIRTSFQMGKQQKTNSFFELFPNGGERSFSRIFIFANNPLDRVHCT